MGYNENKILGLKNWDRWGYIIKSLLLTEIPPSNVGFKTRQTSYGKISASSHMIKDIKNILMSNTRTLALQVTTACHACRFMNLHESRMDNLGDSSLAG